MLLFLSSQLVLVGNYFRLYWIPTPDNVSIYLSNIFIVFHFFPFGYVNPFQLHVTLFSRLVCLQARETNKLIKDKKEIFEIFLQKSVLNISTSFSTLGRKMYGCLVSQSQV